MKSDIALRTTAQFQPEQMPNEAEIQDQTKRNFKAPRSNNHQPKVLATSGPGQSNHLKSLSTSNTNYWSNMQASGLIQVEHQSQMNNSQGRSTETRKKKQQQDAQALLGLANQGQTAKSAVLNTGKPNRDIKKIPSKTKVNEAVQKRKVGQGMKDMQHIFQQDNVLNMHNDTIGI